MFSIRIDAILYGWVNYMAIIDEQSTTFIVENKKLGTMVQSTFQTEILKRCPTKALV